MFNITPIVSANHKASWGELVRLNMNGKTAPEIVQIHLPAADPANAGQVLGICTTNQGGAEDGSGVQIVPSPGQTLVGSPQWLPQNGELFYIFASDGENAQCLSLR